MGKLIQFPCVDHYDEWDYEYENYYGEEFDGNDYGSEVLVKESFVRGFVRKILMFVLVRL